MKVCSRHRDASMSTEHDRCLRVITSHNAQGAINIPVPSLLQSPPRNIDFLFHTPCYENSGRKPCGVNFRGIYSVGLSTTKVAHFISRRVVIILLLTRSKTSY